MCTSTPARQDSPRPASTMAAACRGWTLPDRLRAFARLAPPRAISSAGRAPPRQGGGHWFEPSIAHLRKARYGGLFSFSPTNSAYQTAQSWSSVALALAQHVRQSAHTACVSPGNYEGPRDALGRPRSKVTMPGHRTGRPPPNKGRDMSPNVLTQDEVAAILDSV